MGASLPGWGLAAALSTDDPRGRAQAKRQPTVDTDATADGLVRRAPEPEPKQPEPKQPEPKQEPEPTNKDKRKRRDDETTAGRDAPTRPKREWPSWQVLRTGTGWTLLEEAEDHKEVLQRYLDMGHRAPVVIQQSAERKLSIKMHRSFVAGDGFLTEEWWDDKRGRFYVKRMSEVRKVAA